MSKGFDVEGINNGKQAHCLSQCGSYVEKSYVIQNLSTWSDICIYLLLRICF